MIAQCDTGKKENLFCSGFTNFLYETSTPPCLVGNPPVAVHEAYGNVLRIHRTNPPVFLLKPKGRNGAKDQKSRRIGFRVLFHRFRRGQEIKVYQDD
jgi:hypothetical protein